jgi:hypothetical protein
VNEGWENQPILLWNMGPVCVEPVTGLYLPQAGLLLLLHSLVEQAVLGHSIVHHQHSAVMSKGNNFRDMEFMSKWNACIFLFIAFVLDEGYWMEPNQGYQKF